MVTRYEEYLSFIPDRFGRFRASDSIDNGGKFLTIPVVNLWTDLLKDHIRMVYPSIKFREKKFRFIPTIDIDHAFAYKHRTLSSGPLVVTEGRMMDRKPEKDSPADECIAGYRKDPYDQYDLYP